MAEAHEAGEKVMQEKMAALEQQAKAEQERLEKAFQVRVCASACMHVCVCACVSACLRVCVSACVHACVCACVLACVCACVRVCLRACVRVCARGASVVALGSTLLASFSSPLPFLPPAYLYPPPPLTLHPTPPPPPPSSVSVLYHSLHFPASSCKQSEVCEGAEPGAADCPNDCPNGPWRFRPVSVETGEDGGARGEQQEGQGGAREAGC